MENSAKNFALQLGALITLYVSLGALITLVLGIISIVLPDATDAYYVVESTQSGMRFSIAMLVVFFPAYLILTRVVNATRRRTQTGYLGFTKWLIYLSLLVGGIVMLADLVAVLHNFLSGELTLRFLLKAASILLIVGGAFIYYLFDAREYWQTHEQHAKQYSYGASLLICVFLIAGFMNIDTPKEVRETRIDLNQINDLSSIQYQIEAYSEVHGALPSSLEDAYAGIRVPVAPQNRASYTYEIIDDERYKLCAEFKTTSDQASDRGYTGPVSWAHNDGIWCFERILPQVQKPLIQIEP